MRPRYLSSSAWKSSIRKFVITEKIVGAFSVITNLRMELFQELLNIFPDLSSTHLSSWLTTDIIFLTSWCSEVTHWPEVKCYASVITNVDIACCFCHSLTKQTSSARADHGVSTHILATRGAAPARASTGHTSPTHIHSIQTKGVQNFAVILPIFRESRPQQVPSPSLMFEHQLW